MKTWTTKTGEKVPIIKMGDDHLTNTLRMLLRHAALIQLRTPFPTFNGEMAQYYAEQEYDALMEKTPEDVASDAFPSWDWLLDEAERRRLVTWDLNGYLQFISPAPCPPCAAATVRRPAGRAGRGSST